MLLLPAGHGLGSTKDPYPLSSGRFRQYVCEDANGNPVYDWTILDQRFSKEPYGPFIRRGDDEWHDVVRWYVNALFEAEESGITSENVENIRDTTSDANVRRLLGVTPELGEALGIDPAWVVNAVKAVGNYGEMFERHLGPNSQIGMSRSLNRQWKDGGLIYALPMR